MAARHYDFIDGLRGLAVLWVVSSHLLVLVESTTFTAVDKLFQAGFLGVDIFFVISGFLITGLLLEKKLDWQVVKRFYARRFLKIIPQYYSVLLVGLVLFFALPIHAEHRLTQIGNFFFFPSFFFLLQNYTGYIETLRHTWSLAIEEQFYLAYPLLLLLGVGARSSLRQQWMRSLVLLVVVIGICNYFRYLVGLGFDPMGDQEMPIPGGPRIHKSTLFRVDALVWGGVLKVGELLAGERIHRWKWLAGMSWIIGAAILFYYIVEGVSYRVWFNCTVIYAGAGLLLVGGYFRPGLLNAAWLRWVGRCSYGIFLWHYLFVWIVKSLPLGVLGSAVYWICSIGVGYLSTVTIEKYFLNVRQRLVP